MNSGALAKQSSTDTAKETKSSNIRSERNGREEAYENFKDAV